MADAVESQKLLDDAVKAIVAYRKSGAYQKPSEKGVNLGDAPSRFVSRTAEVVDLSDTGGRILFLTQLSAALSYLIYVKQIYTYAVDSQAQAISYGHFDFKTASELGPDDGSLLKVFKAVTAVAEDYRPDKRPNELVAALAAAESIRNLVKQDDDNKRVLLQRAEARDAALQGRPPPQQAAPERPAQQQPAARQEQPVVAPPAPSTAAPVVTSTASATSPQVTEQPATPVVPLSPAQTPGGGTVETTRTVRTRTFEKPSKFELVTLPNVLLVAGVVVLGALLLSGKSSSQNQ